MFDGCYPVGTTETTMQANSYAAARLQRNSTPPALTITYEQTRDLDGQPWPPPGAGWRLLRRADGSSSWRAILLKTLPAPVQASPQAGHGES
jgi:hypothetical protein